MPTYTYECKKCGQKMQVFHSMSASPRVKCESCGSRSVRRILGTGAGIIFKGGGFYETDYKNKGKDDGAGKKAESKSEGAETKPKETAAKADSDTSSSKKGKSSGSTEAA